MYTCHEYTNNRQAFIVLVQTDRRQKDISGITVQKYKKGHLLCTGHALNCSSVSVMRCALLFYSKGKED